MPAEAVLKGDLVLVRPGEKVPADGVVVEGQSSLDEALITGESLPVAKQPGAELIGGTINGRGVLRFTATRVGADTALAAADIAIAIGSGADVAKEAGDLLLLGNDLLDVVTAIGLSRATMNKIRQNLFLAYIYNSLGVPIAALGWLNPMIAGAAMALSSLSVIVNSSLLRRYRRAAQA